MRGPATVEAEVVRCGHQPRAEVVAPDAVDDHSGGERILRVGDPGGQRLPALRFGRIRFEAPLRGYSGNGCHAGRDDGLTLLTPVAPREDVENAGVLRHRKVGGTTGEQARAALQPADLG